MAYATQKQLADGSSRRITATGSGPLADDHTGGGTITNLGGNSGIGTAA